MIKILHDTPLSAIKAINQLKHCLFMMHGEIQLKE